MWFANHSSSFPLRSSTCATVAVYFRTFVLLIASGCWRPHRLVIFAMLSCPRKKDRESLVGAAKTYRFWGWIPTANRVSINAMKACTKSSVSKTGTFRPLFPLTYRSWSLNDNNITSMNNRVFHFCTFFPVFLLSFILCRNIMKWLRKKFQSIWGSIIWAK